MNNDLTAPQNDEQPDDSVREIDLDTEETVDLQHTTVTPSPHPPSQHDTPSPRSTPVTEIAIDDADINTSAQEFTNVAQPDMEEPEVVTDKGALTGTEVDINDQEQERMGGGEVTLNRVTTYQDVVKEALRTQSMSGAKVLMAEQRKRDQRAAEDEMDSIRKPINKLFLTLTILFIVMAIGTIFAVVYFMNNNGDIDRTSRVIRELYFTPTSVIDLQQAQLGRNTILKIQQVIATPVAPTGIHQINVTKEVDGRPDSTVLVTTDVPYSTNDYLALLEARVTRQLQSSLNQTPLFGLYTKTGNEPFLLIAVDDFDAAYAGMLAWERTMVRDLSPIFSKTLGAIVLEIELAQEEERQARIAQAQAAASSTANTTTPDPAPAPPAPTAPQPTTPQPTLLSAAIFEDLVISNTDARIIKNKNGDVVFFYTFIEDEYLFFGTSPEALNEVRNKIRTARLIL